MLYRRIVSLEKLWPGFNRKPFNSRQLIDLADRLGIIVLPDHSTPRAGIFKFEGETLILYNPHQSEIDLTLALGHELGHYALGHTIDERGLFQLDHFSISGIEKDAGIIGFLFWLPSRPLDCYSDTHTIPERLFDSVKYFEDEISTDRLVEICKARGRIYRAFKRAEQVRFFVPKCTNK